MGIGPSTKETSLHHFRDPLLEVVSEDTDLDLLGLIIVGTPDDNKDKMLVGTRAAAMAECMRADGVIISSDGWGNSDVDYTNTCEQLGIRDDISKTVYKEVYHTARSELTEGTISDKDSLAELQSQAEQVTNICYNRAYKIMKAKVENAQELLSSCKKVLSRRISEQELTRMQNRGV